MQIMEGVRHDSAIGPVTSGAAVVKAVDEVANGGMIVLVDDRSGSDEGLLVQAAESVTQEATAFYLRHTSGLLYVGITPDRAESLDLTHMAGSGPESTSLPLTVSVDWAAGTTTGISAADRALTTRALANPEAPGAGFARPGHVFPVRARNGGVLEYAGRTEAAVDLAGLAGLASAALFSEIVSLDKKGMALQRDLERFAAQYALPIVTVGDVMAYRCGTEVLVRRVAGATLPTPSGRFAVHVVESVLDHVEHLALVMGQVAGPEDPMVRVHHECLLADALGSLGCNCRKELEADMADIEANGRGVLLYLREQRGVAGHGLAPVNGEIDKHRERGAALSERDLISQIISNLQATSL